MDAAISELKILKASAMTGAPENDSEQISLIDLVVTIAENWVLIITVPLLVGAAVFTFLYLEPQSWRAFATVNLSSFELDRMLPEALEGTPPPSGLSIVEIESGLTTTGGGATDHSRLELVLDTPSAVEAGMSFVLQQLVAAVDRDAIPPSAESALARRQELEQEVTLRNSIIQRLTEALEDNSDSGEFDATTYAQLASTLNELLFTLDAKQRELEELSATPPSTMQLLVIETTEPSRLGRSPSL
tara:strand:+ start:1683 stop:2417 length:735 start_codon:yes stop_codon:yes gene_type:complete